jgi:hypothetical protein
MAQLAGVRRQFVKAAMAAPFLEREEERALASGQPLRPAEIFFGGTACPGEGR